MHLKTRFGRANVTAPRLDEKLTKKSELSQKSFFERGSEYGTASVGGRRGFTSQQPQR